jgi:hypothetical protein
MRMRWKPPLTGQPDLRAGLITALLVLLWTRRRGWALAARAAGHHLPCSAMRNSAWRARPQPGIFFGMNAGRRSSSWSPSCAAAHGRSRPLVLNIGRGAVSSGAVSNRPAGRSAVVDYLVVRRDDSGFAFSIADIAVVAGTC